MAAAGAARAQAARWARGGALGPGEAVADGFRAVFRGAGAGAAPGPSGGGGGPGGEEAVLVDRRGDVCLRHWAEEVARATKLGGSVAERATMLALLVAERLGGVAWGEGELERRFRIDFAQVRGEHRDGEVRLGSLAVGLERHRALAFKVLSDVAQVPCRLFGEGGGASAGVSVIDERGDERQMELVGDVGSWKPRRSASPRGAGADLGGGGGARGAGGAKPKASTPPVPRREPFRGLDTFLEQDADAARIRRDLKLDPEKYYDGLGDENVESVRARKARGRRVAPACAPQEPQAAAQPQSDASPPRSSPMARRTDRNAMLRAKQEVDEARKRANAEEAFQRKLKSLYEDGVEPEHEAEVASLVQKHRHMSAEEAESALHIVGGDAERASRVCAMAGAAQSSVRDSAAWLQCHAWDLEEAVRAYRGHAVGSQPQPLHASSGFNSRSSTSPASEAVPLRKKGKAAKHPSPSKGRHAGSAPAENPFYRYTEPSSRDHPLNCPQPAEAHSRWGGGDSSMSGVWRAEMEQRRAAAPPRPATHRADRTRPGSRDFGGGRSPPRGSRGSSCASGKQPAGGARGRPGRPAADDGAYKPEPAPRPGAPASPGNVEELRDAAVSALQRQTVGKDLPEIFRMFGIQVEGGDLRKAYRKAGMLLHPDRNRGQPARLRIEAEEKWKILGAKMNR